VILCDMTQYYAVGLRYIHLCGIAFTSWARARVRGCTARRRGPVSSHYCLVLPETALC
jgi:hypothetical protein